MNSSTMMVVYVSCTCSHDFPPQVCTYVLDPYFLLTHGKYITKLDVLHHSSPREMLESAQLIGREIDDKSLYVYSSNLLHPSSMHRTDTYIPLVQRLFDDVIIQNEFSATKYPYTMAGLQSSLTDKFNEFWRDNMHEQLQSMYKDFQKTRYPCQRGG